MLLALLPKVYQQKNSHGLKDFPGVWPNAVDAFNTLDGTIYEMIKEIFGD